MRAARLVGRDAKADDAHRAAQPIILNEAILQRAHVPDTLVNAIVNVHTRSRRTAGDGLDVRGAGIGRVLHAGLGRILGPAL